MKGEQRRFYRVSGSDERVMASDGEMRSLKFLLATFFRLID
jgi:hypothetical protein